MVGRISMMAAIALVEMTVGCATSVDDSTPPVDSGAPVRREAGGTPTFLDSSVPGTPTGEVEDAGSDAGTSADGSSTTCGDPCPGAGQTTANVTCTPGTGCSFSCKGESYDVNGLPADGCETPDNPAGNHAQMAAVQKPDLDCSSSSSTALVMSGIVPSDARAHETPSVDNFSTATGAAPDYFSVKGTGGALCRNQLSFTLAVTAALQGAASCHKLTVISDKKTLQCTTDANGTCHVDGDSSGNYSSDTFIYFTVEKTCALPSVGNASYTISGHL